MKSFSELTRTEKHVERVRWVGVLPVAMLGGLAGHLLTVSLILHPLLSGLGREGFDRWSRHLIGGFLGGAVFVVSGAKTAPRCRRITALALGACWILTAVGIHWVNHRDIIPVVAATLAAVGGMVFHFSTERSQDQRTELPDNTIRPPGT